MSGNIFITEEGHIKIDTIIYCFTKGNSSAVYLNNGSVCTLKERMETILLKLPGHQFVQLHPSYFINIDFIDRYVSAPPAHVILHNRTIIYIPVSWQKRNEKLLNSL